MIDAKKIILGGVAALALFFSISLYASSSQKIGILDTAALEDSSQFKEIRDKLSKEFQPVQDELAKKQKNFRGKV